MTKDYQFPHCDQSVLHAPGVCVYCDRHPKWQAGRALAELPFTPPEANGWSGNAAVVRGQYHSHMGATWFVGDDE